MNLSISVIVPVRNEASHIGAVLDALLGQDYPSDKYEVLVMDGRSEDETKDIVRKYMKKRSNVHLLDNPKRLSSAARNIGVKNAKGDVILLIDGHCMIDNPRMFSELDSSFRETGADSLGRPQPLELEGASFTQFAIATARRSPLGHHPDSFIYSAKPQPCPAISVAIAYRKELFEKIGMFDERFDACEDAEFNYRIDKAGLKCYFVPSIAVRYVPRETLRGLGVQLVRYGKGRARLTQKHPETFSWKSFLPALFVFCLIIGLPLSLIHPIGKVFGMTGIFGTATLAITSIYWGVVFLYIGIITSVSIVETIKKRDLRLLFMLPCVFAMIHLASGWGVLKETLFPQSQIKARMI